MGIVSQGVLCHSWCVHVMRRKCFNVASVWVSGSNMMTHLLNLGENLKTLSPNRHARLMWSDRIWSSGKGNKLTAVHGAKKTRPKPHIPSGKGSNLCSILLFSVSKCTIFRIDWGIRLFPLDKMTALCNFFLLTLSFHQAWTLKTEIYYQTDRYKRKHKKNWSWYSSPIQDWVE